MIRKNSIVSEPATVDACKADRGTAEDRAARADEKAGQLESARFAAKAAAEAPRGRR